VHVTADQSGRDEVDLAALVVGVRLAEGGGVADRGDRRSLGDDRASGITVSGSTMTVPAINMSVWF